MTLAVAVWEILRAPAATQPAPAGGLQNKALTSRTTWLVSAAHSIHIASTTNAQAVFTSGQKSH